MYIYWGENSPLKSWGNFILHFPRMRVKDKKEHIMKKEKFLSLNDYLLQHLKYVKHFYTFFSIK